MFKKKKTITGPYRSYAAHLATSNPIIFDPDAGSPLSHHHNCTETTDMDTTAMPLRTPRRPRSDTTVLQTAPDFVLFRCGPSVFVIRFSSLMRKNLKKLSWKSNIMIYLVPPNSDNKSASVTQQSVADLVTTHATGWKYNKVIKICPSAAPPAPPACYS